MKNQLIFVLTAASATGKTTCAKLACERGEDLALSVSFSTRPIRPGEVDGVDKFFISDAEFSRMQDKREFVEETEIFGYRCGHTEAILDKISSGKNDLIMILDYRGMRKIKQKFLNVVSIFLLPPNEAAIQNRLDRRPGAKGEHIKARLESAKGEMRDYVHYDYTVINDKIDRAVDDILSIVHAERLRTRRQASRYHDVIRELTE